MSVISVSIVEDDEDFNESIARLIENTPGMQLLDRFVDGSEANVGLLTQKTDVVLLDINMPNTSGIECLKFLKPKMPDSQFIILTSYNDDESVFEALQSGASGYLLKRCSPSDILDAIIDVHSGGSPMSSYIARRVVQSFSKPAKASKMENVNLTPREDQILKLLSKGYLYKEIAAELTISIDTVRTHLRRIYGKLQVHSRTEAVVKYLDHDV